MTDDAPKSHTASHRQLLAIAALTGLPVIAVTALVMLGWILRTPWMVQIIPGATAMVFSNALCLFMLGTALILAALRWRWSKLVQKPATLLP